MIELEYDFIYTKYWLESPAWAISDLAKHYNCSYSTIQRFMVKHEIPRRNMSDAMVNVHKCPSKRENYRRGFEKRGGFKNYGRGLKKRGEVRRCGVNDEYLENKREKHHYNTNKEKLNNIINSIMKLRERENNRIIEYYLEHQKEGGN